MVKFKKALKLEVITIILSVLFILSNVLNACPAYKDTLRPPLSSNDQTLKIRFERKKVELILNKLISNLSRMTNEDKKKSILGMRLFGGIIFAIDKCFEEGQAYQAGKLAISAITNHIPGITSDKVNEWIDKCFEEGWTDEAGELAITAIKDLGLSDEIKEILNLLNNPAICLKDGLGLRCLITSYALEHNRLDDIVNILTSVKDKEYIVKMLIFLMIKGGADAILEEHIFTNEGLEKLAKLYNNVYNHLYEDILPEDIDLRERRTSFMLDQVSRFSISKNKRNDLTLEEIYHQFYRDYKAGRIKPLPEDILTSKVIDVATRRNPNLTSDAKDYCVNIMQSAKQALSYLENNNETPYKEGLDNLSGLIEERIIILNNNLKGKTDIAKENIEKDIIKLSNIKAILTHSDGTSILPILNLTKKEIKVISNITVSKINMAAPIIRSLLFIYAFKDNESWHNYFKSNAESPPSAEIITQLVSFINSFIKPHLLDELDNDKRKVLLTHLNVKIFKEEIDRLSKGRTQFTRKIRITATRGWIAEYIGYFSDECWTATRNIMRDNPDTIALIFSDEDTQEILGGTLLMPNSINGKKILIDRGLSPRIEVTSSLNTESFVEQVTDFEERIARKLGANKIVVPLRRLDPGLGTNNPDIIQYYERIAGNNSPIILDTPNTFNDHDITEGKCVIFRKIDLSISHDHETDDSINLEAAKNIGMQI